MFKIANLLLTRRCNLKCDYCRISAEINYDLKPEQYPPAEYYYNNEKDTDWWCNFFDNMKKENPDCFSILYGGEPFLRDDLDKLVLHLHKNEQPYTIISNCTDVLKDKREKFFESVGKVMGFTASVDPGFYLEDSESLDSLKKSVCGFNVLKDLIKRDLVQDPVAEITCDSTSIYLLEDTVKRLSDEGIYSDITVLDISRSNWHDFSTIMDESPLVHPTQLVKEIFDRLSNSNYLIHMKKTLLPRIFEILPANLNCNLRAGNLHAIAVDSDGSMRTCLRLKGMYAPQFSANDLFNENRTNLEEAIECDKQVHCQIGCAHTCYIMSQLDQSEINNH